MVASATAPIGPIQWVFCYTQITIKTISNSNGRFCYPKTRVKINFKKCEITLAKSNID